MKNVSHKKSHKGTTAILWESFFIADSAFEYNWNTNFADGIVCFLRASGLGWGLAEALKKQTEQHNWSMDKSAWTQINRGLFSKKHANIGVVRDIRITCFLVQAAYIIEILINLNRFLIKAGNLGKRLYLYYIST